MPNRRQLKWFTTLRNLQALADNSQLTFDLLTDLSASLTQGATIQRMLVDIWLRNDTIQNEKTMDWGIVLVDGEAASAGIFPDADDEDERVPWLGRGRMHVFCNVFFEANPNSYMHRDLRAQRIMRDEFKQLRLICDLDTNGAGGVFVTFSTRVLVMMP